MRSTNVIDKPIAIARLPVASRCVRAAVFIFSLLLGPLSTAALSDQDLEQQSNLGPLIEGMFDECQTEARFDSCDARRIAALTGNDVCGLGSQVIAGNVAAIDQLIRVCLPTRMFVGRDFVVGEYSVKGDILESIGRSMPDGIEAVSFIYSVSVCPMDRASFSGIVYLDAEIAEILVLGSIPVNCVNE